MENKTECYNFDDFNFPLIHDDIQNIIQKMKQDFSIATASVSIICLDRNALREMKKKYFAEDRFTDVISFLFETSKDSLEGEIYISPEDIKLNAVEFNTSYQNEAARIIIHGMLHLLGYDDIESEDKKEMTDLENKFLSILAY
ncbi:MAG: rRNA maturation RNase YbeY [Candidatus Marinimicrobia bacterium]|nr:rRNA maturation RNase YbeY [Candidatus Neomarinimicrobiota bacterium]